MKPLICPLPSAANRRSVLTLGVGVLGRSMVGRLIEIRYEIFRRMPFSIYDLCLGGLLPAIVAGIVMFALRRCLVADLADRYSGSIALWAGFLCGYALIGLGPLLPATHWHWLWLTACAAALIGPIANAKGVRGVERLLLYALLAVTSSWFLVPTWPDLVPDRGMHLAVLAVALTGLMFGYQTLTTRLNGPWLPSQFWLTMTSASVLMALTESLRFAQIGIAGASGMFGCFVVSFFFRDKLALKGTAALVAMLILGLLYIGRVNTFSDVSLLCYLLIAMAPLTLWIMEIPPLKQLPHRVQIALSLTLPLTPQALALTLATLT